MVVEDVRLSPSLRLLDSGLARAPSPRPPCYLLTPSLHFLSRPSFCRTRSSLRCLPRHRCLSSLLVAHPGSFSRLTRECRSARAPAGRRPVPRDCRIGCLPIRCCRSVVPRPLARSCRLRACASARWPRGSAREFQILARALCLSPLSLAPPLSRVTYRRPA